MERGAANDPRHFPAPRARQRRRLRGARGRTRPHLPQLGRRQLRHRHDRAVRRVHVRVRCATGKLLVLIPGPARRRSTSGGTLGFVPAALHRARHRGRVRRAAVRRRVPAAPRTHRRSPARSRRSACSSSSRASSRTASGQTPGQRVDAIFPAHRWQWGSVTLLSDRFYLAVVDRRPHARAHRAVPLDPLRPAHPGRRRDARPARSSAASRPSGSRCSTGW